MQPGGSVILRKYAGRDATAAFIATPHSHAATLKCWDYDVGALEDTPKLQRAADKAKAHRDRIRALAKYLED